MATRLTSSTVCRWDIETPSVLESLASSLDSGVHILLASMREVEEELVSRRVTGFEGLRVGRCYKLVVAGLSAPKTIEIIHSHEETCWDRELLASWEGDVLVSRSSHGAWQ
jgi:hypothetical protein